MYINILITPIQHTRIWILYTNTQNLYLLDMTNPLSKILYQILFVMVAILVIAVVNEVEALMMAVSATKTLSYAVLSNISFASF